MPAGDIGTETYAFANAPFSDRAGTFTSNFDGSTQIAYSYTNFDVVGNVVSGDFSFNVVPEPSSALLILGTLPLLVRRRR